MCCIHLRLLSFSFSLSRYSVSSILAKMTETKTHQSLASSIFVEACEHEDWKLAQDLIECRKIDLRTPCLEDGGYLPLHMTVAFDGSSLLHYLVNRHKETLREIVNAITKTGKTPLHYACARASKESIQVLLQHGA